MKKGSKQFFTLLTVALALSLALCPLGIAEQPAAGSEKGTIMVSIPTAQSPFCYDFAAGVVAAAQERGYVGVIDDPDVKLASQIAAIENHVSAGTKGIVLFPVDGMGISDAAQAAVDAGVVVTAFDAATPCNIRISEDEVATGRQIAQAAAEWVQANLGGKTEIAILAVTAADDSRNGRILSGIQEGLAEMLPESQVVSVQKSTDSGEMMAIVENVVQANPNVRVFISQMDNVIVTEVLRTLGMDREDVALVGASANDADLALIAAGSVFRAAIVTDIKRAGYDAGIATIDQVEGKQPGEAKVQNQIVTVENAKDYMP